jgi:hypothetical protein
VVKVRLVVLKGVVVKKDERKVLFRMRVVMVAGEKDVLVVSGRLVASTAYQSGGKLQLPMSVSAPAESGLHCTSSQHFPVDPTGLTSLIEHSHSMPCYGLGSPYLRTTCLELLR